MAIDQDDGIDVGDTRVIVGTFTDTADPPNPVAVNLTQVILTIQKPDGTEEEKTNTQLTDGGVGIVTYKQRFLEAGRWRFRWDWNNGIDSESDEFVLGVKKPRVSPSALAQ